MGIELSVDLLSIEPNSIVAQALALTRCWENCRFSSQSGLEVEVHRRRARGIDNFGAGLGADFDIMAADVLRTSWFRN